MDTPPCPAIRWIAGGCVYRNMVHVGHVGSLLSMVATSMTLPRGPRFVGIDYMHTSELPRARCVWLRRCMDDKHATHAVSIDSDSEFDGPELLSLLECVSGSVAIGVVPFYIGGTEYINVNRLAYLEDVEEERMSHEALRGAFLGARAVPISSGGFGVAVFNLDWFRSHWSPEPESWDLRVDSGEPRRARRAVITVGEDIALCRSVRHRAADVVALRVSSSHNLLVTTSGDVPRLTWK